MKWFLLFIALALPVLANAEEPPPIPPIDMALHVDFVDRRIYDKQAETVSELLQRLGTIEQIVVGLDPDAIPGESTTAIPPFEPARYDLQPDDSVKVMLLSDRVNMRTDQFHQLALGKIAALEAQIMGIEMSSDTSVVSQIQLWGGMISGLIVALIYATTWRG